jgi:hypothetical protein
LAWTAYADQYDGKLVYGHAFGRTGIRMRWLNGWVGSAFSNPPKPFRHTEESEQGHAVAISPEHRRLPLSSRLGRLWGLIRYSPRRQRWADGRDVRA